MLSSWLLSHFAPPPTQNNLTKSSACLSRPVADVIALSPLLDGVPLLLLQVIKLMQSFKSRELVTELFAWRHYYWFLTDEGIEYLRVYLNLPSEIVPATLKKSTRPLEKDGGRPPRRDYGDRPPRREGGFGGDRRWVMITCSVCVFVYAEMPWHLAFVPESVQLYTFFSTHICHGLQHASLQAAAQQGL